MPSSISRWISPFVAESLVKRIHPGVFMPVETDQAELLRAIRERHIPVMMVNGRI